MKRPQYRSNQPPCWIWVFYHQRIFIQMNLSLDAAAMTEIRSFPLKQPKSEAQLFGPPYEKCNSTEFVETLVDFRIVCVPPANLLLYIDIERHRRPEIQNYNIIPVMMPFPRNREIMPHTDTETPQTPTYDYGDYEETPQTPTDDYGDYEETPHTPTDNYGDYEKTPPTTAYDNEGDDRDPDCIICTKTKALDPVNPESVKSFKVDFQKLPCTVHISVNLEDEDFCLDLEDHWSKDVLEELEFANPLLSKTSPRDVAAVRNFQDFQMKQWQFEVQ
ncbi:uncharacterized protein LOC117504989 [Thalassophryne amazonica]|uniref:uncharacterized protein LOC117504989 n=1 Tax=Thalassophryne amazonica TaxID=390379 RepID=UPI001470B369|nr:uncharacterized protein LOC117504989 [Thalassophryne amazonica]XP_034020386.1 uncharacterized protein LOC117504989 [Thalassophryne amazonica]